MNKDKNLTLCFLQHRRIKFCYKLSYFYFPVSYTNNFVKFYIAVLFTALKTAVDI